MLYFIVFYFIYFYSILSYLIFILFSPATFPYLFFLPFFSFLFFLYSVNSEENRVTNRLAVLAGVRNRVRALVLTPCTFNTAPSTVRTSFLNSSVTLQDLVKKMSPLFSVKHSADHSWKDKNKNENKNINKNKNKNENILGIRNIPPSVSARTTHDCTYDVTVLESVYEHRSDGEGGRGGIMVYLKIKNTSMCVNF